MICNPLQPLIGCGLGMRLLFLLAVIGLTIFPAFSSTASRHTSSKQTLHVSRAAHRRVRSHHTARHTRRHLRHSGKRVRRYQLHPTVARYKQIQQALASKGYYNGEIDGKWGPESVSALQRFQTEQGIGNEGKITALALIGLGLGPRRQHMTMPATSAGTAQSVDESEASADGPQESKSMRPGSAVTANQ